MNLRPPRPERGDLSSESRDFVDVHLDCMRSFHFVHVPAAATSADPGGPGPRRLNRIDRARVRASDPHNRVDGLNIGRIPLTRHAAWSAKFSPQQITQTRARVEHVFGAQVTAPGGLASCRRAPRLACSRMRMESAQMSGNGRHAKRKALTCHLVRCEHIGVNRGLKCRRQDNVACGELQRFGE